MSHSNHFSDLHSKEMKIVEETAEFIGTIGADPYMNEEDEPNACLQGEGDRESYSAFLGGELHLLQTAGLLTPPA